jgi:hypothetical protein
MAQSFKYNVRVGGIMTKTPMHRRSMHLDMQSFEGYIVHSFGTDNLHDARLATLKTIFLVIRCAREAPGGGIEALRPVGIARTFER